MQREGRRHFLSGGISWRFAILLVALISVPAILLLAADFTEGQISESPDGRFRISVTRLRKGVTGSVRYRVDLTDIASGKTLRAMTIIPVDGYPSQSPRGAATIVQWDNDCQFAELMFDGQPYCRLQAVHSSTSQAAEIPAEP